MTLDGTFLFQQREICALLMERPVYIKWLDLEMHESLYIAYLKQLECLGGLRMYMDTICL